MSDVCLAVNVIQSHVLSGYVCGLSRISYCFSVVGYLLPCSNIQLVFLSLAFEFHPVSIPVRENAYRSQSAPDHVALRISTTNRPSLCVFARLALLYTRVILEVIVSFASPLDNAHSSRRMAHHIAFPLITIIPQYQSSHINPAPLSYPHRRNRFHETSYYLPAHKSS